MKVNITIALVLMCISTLQPTGGTDPFVLPYAFVSLNLQQDTSTDPDSLLRQAYAIKSQGKREEARPLFEKLMQDYPRTTVGVEARWMVAYYRLNDRQFDEAQRLFQQVADDPLAKPDIAAEALLQTGFVYLSRFWAQPPVSGEERYKLLESAKTRLLQIARNLSARTDEVGRTAAAYALLGVGEACSYQGDPFGAEKHYRTIVSMKEGVSPVVLAQAWYGLGVSLYRQRRYGEALEAFEVVKQFGESGEGMVLRALALGNALPERAWLWQGAIWAHLGYPDRSVAALEQGVNRPERLAGKRNSLLLAQARRSLEGMRQVLARRQEQERKMAEAKRLAQQLELAPMTAASSSQVPLPEK
ncbi:MAG: tetratricopeptide repeat protein [Firmicutes bacterium]|nr:tetratricopeptide repeat protein [Bacillota bacterium]